MFTAETQEAWVSVVIGLSPPNGYLMTMLLTKEEGTLTKTFKWSPRI